MSFDQIPTSRRTLLTTIGASLTVSQPAIARTTERAGQQFFAYLSAANVPSSDEYSPYTETDALGGAFVELNSDETELNYTVFVKNMSNITGIHIHQGGPDENGPHLAELANYSEPPGFSVMLRNILQQGDECPTDSGGNNCLTPGVSFSQMVDEIRAGTAYVQAHAGSEGTKVIRGQLG